VNSEAEAHERATSETLTEPSPDALAETLDDQGASSLTVLEAGVGYGKTTLVRSWCVERPEPVIWMTLDSAERAGRRACTWPRCGFAILKTPARGCGRSPVAPGMSATI
jgi:hypothetical protein